MLIDEILPVYDFTEIHNLKIRASAENTFQAVTETTLGDISGIVKILFEMRMWPERMVGRKTEGMHIREPMLTEMYNSGFTKLAEQPPVEVVFGTIVPRKIGRVWDKSSSLKVDIKSAQEFRQFNNPEYLVVVANIRVEDSPEPGRLLIRTESRTRALSPQARTSFTPYWRMIRPFSGLIRRLWLRGIKNRAEKAQTSVATCRQKTEST